MMKNRLIFTKALLQKWENGTKNHFQMKFNWIHKKLRVEMMIIEERLIKSVYGKGD